jgi:endonuclease-3 related protein
MTARDKRKREIMDASDLYDMLLVRYGDLDWWPAEGPFEVVVGAVLTQRTSWTNVERTLSRLRKAYVQGPSEVLGMPRSDLEELIRPTGTYRQKASRLVDLMEAIAGPEGEDLDQTLLKPKDELRQRLLSVTGIGPETADSILLYAANQLVFVVDAYTRRLLERLDVDAGRTYEDVAAWFTRSLPLDVDVYRNCHAVIVEHGKEHCRAKPRCGGCPLTKSCPSEQAVDYIS